jgi:hypothetical protein
MKAAAASRADITLGCHFAAMSRCKTLSRVNFHYLRSHRGIRAKKLGSSARP